MTCARHKKLEELVLEMLKTFLVLGNDPMARIDARLWHRHFKRKFAKL